MSQDWQDQNPEESTHNNQPPQEQGGIQALITRLQSLDLPLPEGINPLLIVMAGVVLIAGAAGLLVLVLLGRSGAKDEAELPRSVETLAVNDELEIRVLRGGTSGVEVSAMTVDEAVDLGQYIDAFEALPPFLVPVSSVYEVDTRKEVQLLFTIPDDNPELVDAYYWDTEAGKWQFAPSTPGASSETIVLENYEAPVALFRTTSVAALLGTTVNGSQPLTAEQASLMNILFVPGIQITPDGSLDTALFAWSDTPGSFLLFPVISADDSDALDALLDDDTLQAEFTTNITKLAVDEGYAGVLIDFETINDSNSEAYHRLIEGVAQAFSNEDILLAVRVPEPEPTESSWDSGAYDWARLGKAADLLAVQAPGNPGAYHADGAAEDFLIWALRHVNRVKLYVSTSARSVDDWEGQLNYVSYEFAVRPIGSVQLAPGSVDLRQSIQPGDPLVFELTGMAVNLERDVASGVYRYDAFAGDGIHRVWLVTGSALRSRLDWIADFNVGGIIVDDLLQGESHAGALNAVEEFKLDQPSTLEDDLSVRWQIARSNGEILLERNAALSSLLEWTPEEEGEYIISADLAGQGIMGLGAEALIVGGERFGIVTEEQGVVSGAPENIEVERANANTDIPGERINPADVPPPVIQPAAFGNFELGGQVNHVVENPDYMKEAGMKWVKFQLAWGEADSASRAYELIQQGKQNNFKVLLSIVSQEKYPRDVDPDKFVDFVRGVAYYGPDAIEVWNEQNIYYEWPQGQIDGGIYVRDILAPSYNAIKEINPNIMVISGAPAPTGAYYADGGCSLQGYGCDDWVYLEQMARAGGANYMDCVGAHFNSGATAPSATTGHPADPGFQHYSWYYGSMVQLYSGTFGRPVCFTELGYLSGEGYGAVPERFNWASDISVQEQAQWLAEAAQLSRENGLVRLMIVWNVDFWFWGDDPMAGYAIVRPDGSCPACSSLGRVTR